MLNNLSLGTQLLFLLIALMPITSLASQPATGYMSIQDTTKQISDTTYVDSTGHKRKWTTKDSYVSGSVEWTNEDGDKEMEFDLRFGASFIGRIDEIDLKLISDFNLVNGAQDENEQYLRVNWYHTIYNNWYLVGKGRVERNQRTINDNPYDYMFLLGGIGPGYYFETKIGGSRLSVLYNYMHAFVIKGDIDVHTNTPSIYLDNNYQLSKNINLKNWSNVFFWTKDDAGCEIETELAYSITKNLALGIRDYILFNGPTLQHKKNAELRIFLKITF